MAATANRQVSDNRELQRRLATYLLQLDEGRRLPSVRDITAGTGASIGSASKALTSLESLGAVRINRRGHLGSFVVERSLGELWKIAEREPIVIAMTSPSNPRFEGLATALKAQFTVAGVACYIICVRGAAQRLQALREHRCHVAIMSALAAAKLGQDTEEVVLTLPAMSWVSHHRLYYRPKQGESPDRLRVAIDRTSPDHEHLTELVFAGSDVEFKQVSAWQIHRLLAEGKVDAAVWDTDDMDAHPGHLCLSEPLPDDVRRIVGEANTSAALIIRRGSTSVRAVAHAVLCSDAIMTIQQQVMHGEIAPEF
jgi:hypothetical protein